MVIAHLDPDPFDKEVEALLRDPAVLADLDEQHAQLERGELKMYSHAEVRERLRALGFPLVDVRAGRRDARGEQQGNASPAPG